MLETQRMFECYDCKHEWEVPYGTGRPHQCPKCGSTNIHRHSADKGSRGVNSSRRGRGLCLHGTQRKSSLRSD